MLTKKDRKEVTINLELLSERFKLEIDYLKTYLDMSEKSNELVNKELSDKAFEETEKFPEKEALIQDLYEKEYKAINSYQYHSQLVLVYGIYESTLTHLCVELFKFTRSKLSLNKIKGGNIAETCIDYLILISDFDRKEIERYAPKLNNYRLVRNYIAHQNSIFTGSDPSEIAKDRKKFCKLIELLKKERFEVDEKSFYIIDNDVNRDLLLIVSKVIEQVINYLESKTFLVEQ